MTGGRDPAERRAAAAIDLARSGSRDARIEIAEYDSAWPARFSAEAARLAEIVAALSLHHIGSTAVPGLAAKPIIDMMAVVEDLDAPVAKLVGPAGYEYPPPTTRRRRGGGGSVARRRRTGPTTCISSPTGRRSTATCASATPCATSPG